MPASPPITTIAEKLYIHSDDNMLIIVCCVCYTQVILASGKVMRMLYYCSTANHIHIVKPSSNVLTIFNHIMCLICLFTGASRSDQVYQTPAHMYKDPGTTATIYCSHSIQNYDQILWYKQLQSRHLQLLGYAFGDSTFLVPGRDLELDGNANKDQNCTLTFKDLGVNSDAVYFCAACYHSASYHCASMQQSPITLEQLTAYWHLCSFTY